MKKVENLIVTVQYKVGFGGLEIPQKVYDQLVEANENGVNIDPSRMQNVEASEWLTDNIKERDCMDWECEIDDIR